MKTYIHVLLFVIVCVLAKPCAYAEAPDFPQIGQTYLVEFVAPTERQMPPNAAFSSGSVVKVVARARGGWCEVEYQRAAWDEHTKKYTVITVRTWLNFDVLLAAKQVDEQRKG
jgi:hypothetical protein